MKKLLIILMPLILFSCFEYVGTSTSKRVLNLALAAPPDVAKLHIAVFNGVATPDQLIYKQTVAAGSSIPFEVPAGDNRIIVVWAEGYDGYANYYGYTPPINISEDNTIPVPIKMNPFSSAFGLIYTAGNRTFTWNTIPGAISYNIRYFTYSLSMICSGAGYYNVISISNSVSVVPACVTVSNYTIQVLTSVFDLMTKWN
jgi:hypothetical protein